MLKKRELIIFSKDRLAIVLVAVLFLIALILDFSSLLNTHISDVQVPIRYSSYGFTNLYRDRWYSLWSFGIFGTVLFIFNGYLAVKLHPLSRGLSIGILSISILVCMIGLLVAGLVFRLSVLSL